VKAYMFFNYICSAVLRLIFLMVGLLTRPTYLVECKKCTEVVTDFVEGNHGSERK
jgi:hypothetical protein